MLNISGTITAVPRPTTEATLEEWQRLAEAVKERMAETGMLMRDFEDHGVSRSVASQILNPNPAKVTFETRILRNLCVALGWRASSFERIMRGDDPSPIPVAADQTITLRQSDFEPEAWAVLQQIVKGRRTRPSPEPEPE